MARRPIPTPDVAITFIERAPGLMAADWYDYLRELARPQIATLTYGTSIATDARTGDSFIVTANNATAFAIAAPTNPIPGQVITYTIRNSSGGALGAVTWNAVFKMAAWTSPANGSSRSISFHYDGTNWVERSRTTADVPN